MLRILGSARKLCGGMTRRDSARIGGLGLAGMSLADLAAWQAAGRAATRWSDPSRFGRAKSIILIHLYGSPSQIEWVDPKPNAPVEIRGELGSIPSSLPGCDVCELLPKFAKVMDRTTVLRSMTHPYPLHGVAFALTGVPTLDLPAELNPRDPRNWPFFGSVVDYVEAQRERAGQTPRRARAGQHRPAVSIQQPPRGRSAPRRSVRHVSGRRVRSGLDRLRRHGDQGAGQDAGRQAVRRQRSVHRPQPGQLLLRARGDESCRPTSRSIGCNRRKSLVAQLDDARRDLAVSPRGKQFDRYRQMTYELLRVGQAAQCARPAARSRPTMRELYGHTLFGQSCLAARRLVEAGSRMVSVFWDEYGLAGSGWDTHYNHYARMKQELCPGLDQGWYGLITDLDQRGLLDDTLVVCTSEHGRTPKITTGQGGGRDHWSRVYSSLMAGGGTKRGHVVGASDKHGGDVADRPISPKDLLATMYHLLGIDHHTMVHDTLGRPLPLVDGQVITEALA